MRYTGYSNLGRTNLWTVLAAGLIGGLVACWTINRFPAVWSKLADGIEGWSDNEFQNVWGESAQALEDSSNTKFAGGENFLMSSPRSS